MKKCKIGEVPINTEIKPKKHLAQQLNHKHGLQIYKMDIERQLNTLKDVETL